MANCALSIRGSSTATRAAIPTTVFIRAGLKLPVLVEAIAHEIYHAYEIESGRGVDEDAARRFASRWRREVLMLLREEQ